MGFQRETWLFLGRKIFKLRTKRRIKSFLGFFSLRFANNNLDQDIWIYFKGNFWTDTEANSSQTKTGYSQKLLNWTVLIIMIITSFRCTWMLCFPFLEFCGAFAVEGQLAQEQCCLISIHTILILVLFYLVLVEEGWGGWLHFQGIGIKLFSVNPCVSE